MDFIKVLTLSLLLCGLTCGCQITYLTKSAYNQLKILNNREPIEDVLKKDNVSEEEKRKLKLALEVREFAFNQLHLTQAKNYSTYTKLDRPYVVYALSAAPKWKLEHHYWSYPLYGKMPYRGFFNIDEAKEAEQELQQEEKLDTYLRGVGAYSTLGWFADPILSSMTSMDDYDFVNTLIHELTHVTLFIKNNVDFNERLANFVGTKGAELFYKQREGESSLTLKQAEKETHDEHLFSSFISEEIKNLKTWYLEQKNQDEEARTKRFTEIQERFKTKVLPQMQTDSYKKFAEIKLNNARLLLYKTYMEDMTDFEKVWNKSNQDIKLFLETCKKLESSKDPEKDLKSLSQN